ncbi:hypothetical protein F1737_08765 [Methanoplanus sp. FWC-SCC4]|uniref:Uncharacterized protein n=1 Tax=Methanochimaera problematica TaxID=2609417 RepID=A0AA97FC95_9EURY|nr:hypothetical protein F1737_08765 [Methanoplanus sp. FWC-SCC4]
MKRALKEINTKISLSDYVPKNTSNPIDYFVDQQYPIRCDLFHAKGSNCILPFSEIEISNIANAYEYLHRLWKKITNVYFYVPNSGGSFTIAGFKDLTNGVFSEGFEMLAVDDPNMPQITDKECNLGGYPEISFSNYSLDNISLPDGIIAKGNIEGEILAEVNYLYKFCLLSENNLFMFKFFEDGITLMGTDKMECWFSVRLKSNDLP